MISAVTLYVISVVFVATVVRTALGFGEALVAVPLLVLFLPAQVTIPLVMLISILVAICIVARDWRHMHLRSAGWLIFFALLGIPLGLYALKRVDIHIIKGILAVIVISFSLYSLIGRRTLHLKSDNMAWLFCCGFCSGVLGGAYAINGPPLVIYGALRRWSAQHFRATMQAYFLPVSVVIMGGYWAQGLWIHDVTRYFLLSLPGAVAAIFIGQAIHNRLHEQPFFKYVYGALVVIGGVLLVQALRK
jgi:uncharacterized membrane protein YfcA